MGEEPPIAIGWQGRRRLRPVGRHRRCGRRDRGPRLALVHCTANLGRGVRRTLVTPGWCIDELLIIAKAERPKLDAIPQMGEITMNKRQALGGFAQTIVLALCLIPTTRDYSNPVPHGFYARSTTMLAANPRADLSRF